MSDYQQINVYLTITGRGISLSLNSAVAWLLTINYDWRTIIEPEIRVADLPSRAYTRRQYLKQSNVYNRNKVDENNM